MLSDKHVHIDGAVARWAPGFPVSPPEAAADCVRARAAATRSTNGHRHSPWRHDVPVTARYIVSSLVIVIAIIIITINIIVVIIDVIINITVVVVAMLLQEDGANRA